MVPDRLAFYRRTTQHPHSYPEHSVEYAANWGHRKASKVLWERVCVGFRSYQLPESAGFMAKALPSVCVVSLEVQLCGI